MIQNTRTSTMKKLDYTLKLNIKSIVFSLIIFHSNNNTDYQSLAKTELTLDFSRINLDFVRLNLDFIFLKSRFIFSGERYVFILCGFGCFFQTLFCTFATFLNNGF